MPLPMNVFWPLISQSSPSRTALVRMPRRSEPAPGSVQAMEVTISPDTMPGQPAALEVIGAVGQQVGEDHVIVQVEGEADGEVVALGEFLVQHGAEAVVVHAHAAELLRDRQAQQALLAGRRPQLAGHHVVRVPLRVVRGHRRAH